MRKVRNILLAIIIIFAVAFAALYNIPWSYKINKTVQGVECRIGDPDYSEKVTIKIDGTYKQYLFKNNTFKGNISIDKYAFTKEKHLQQTTFYNNTAFLIYHNIQYGNIDSNIMGDLCCTPDFSKLLITISEPIDADTKSMNVGDLLFISAPADNRSTAFKISRDLSKNASSFLQLVKWE